MKATARRLLFLSLTIVMGSALLQSSRASAPVLLDREILSDGFDSLASFSEHVDRIVHRLSGMDITLAALEDHRVSDSTMIDALHDPNFLTVSLLPYAGALGVSTFGTFAEPGFAFLGSEVQGREDMLRQIRRYKVLTSFPLTLPVSGRVSSDFGMRNHPILRRRRAHKGIDIAAPRGTEIYATGGGVVTFAGRKGGYGNIVIIDHGFGYETRYAHCSSLEVSQGDRIERGQLIALVGSTGRSTGPRLHYEVRLDGEALNPAAFMLFDRETIPSLEALAIRPFDEKRSATDTYLASGSLNPREG